MTRTSKRRFIAGAVCPRCAEMDTVVVYQLEGVDYRECVSCDFQEKADFQQSQPELPTRVNRPEPERADEEIQVVKILDPSDKDK